MKVMGIDGSSRKTGVAFYDGRLRHYELLDFGGSGDYNGRFSLMAMGIEALVSDHKPDAVYMEDSWECKGQVVSNVATLKKLSYIIGAVKYICVSYKIPFNLLYPSEWRKAIGFSIGKVKRDELKKMAVDYAANRYGVDVNDDVADAICIAEAGYILNSKLFG